MKSIQRNQGGFSLVEILLVLGIIAILAIAAFIIFPQVQASNRANSEQSNITTVTAGIKSLYGATRDYSAISNSVVNRARVFPASMNGGQFTATQAITSSWSDTVTVGPGPVNSQFEIVYANVPTEVCTRLIPGLVQNFETITIGTTALADDDGPAEIVDACTATGNPVNVEFVSN